MKETGKMIAWMDKVVFLCQMVQFSKVNFKTENFTVMVFIAGLMVQNMKVWQFIPFVLLYSLYVVRVNSWLIFK